MPLSKDEKGGGTEIDGRKSSQYCSHCYDGGRFTDPDLTAEQMVEKVRAKMREMHIPGFLAKSVPGKFPRSDAEPNSRELSRLRFIAI